MHSPLRLLLIGSTPQLASFAQRHCGPGANATADLATTVAGAEAMLCGDLGYDAIVLDAGGVVVAAAEVEAIAARAALVVVVVEPDAEHTLGWLRSGAEDVLGPDELLGSGRTGGGCASRSSGGAATSAASPPTPPIPAPACRIAASWSST